MRTILIILSLLIFTGCSNLVLKTHKGWMGPDVYELTDGITSITYYNGQCCCVAKQVLEEIQRRVDNKELVWSKFKDDAFARDYVQKVCEEVRNKKP